MSSEVMCPEHMAQDEVFKHGGEDEAQAVHGADLEASWPWLQQCKAVRCRKLVQLGPGSRDAESLGPRTGLGAAGQA